MMKNSSLTNLNNIEKMLYLEFILKEKVLLKNIDFKSTIVGVESIDVTYHCICVLYKTSDGRNKTLNIPLSYRSINVAINDFNSQIVYIYKNFVK